MSVREDSITKGKENEEEFDTSSDESEDEPENPGNFPENSAMEEDPAEDGESGDGPQFEEFLSLMKDMFLTGKDGKFVDYNTIDNDTRLDDIGEMNREAEEKYFDDDE